ncbi:DUF397 domain-containing protein [Actinomadura rudentiformis]|uniref:DUF397 domain-containing protein n=1 Tax=Actinomadura rudentiformis TaxID=359158 RepID=A0A6H9YNB8_9ACTN|nr:DUF397 domain-containing protein [Actinomadura rudentiformis]
MTTLEFRKPSRCEELNQDGCVEVANGPGFVAVRDSTDQDGPVILVGRNGWQQFVATLRSGDGR